MFAFGLFLVLGAAGLFVFTAWCAKAIERDFPPKGRFVAVGSGKIHVAELFPSGASRATIVLLHGASGNQADVMTALGEPLARLGYHVVAPDRPGHGWSDRICGPAAASPAVQADVLRRAFVSMGIERAVVVGHSWSGALAARFALAHSDFTLGLVLLAPVTHPWPKHIAWYNRLAAGWGVGHVFTRLLTLPFGLLLIGQALPEVFAPCPVPDSYVRANGALMLLRPAEFRANAQDIVDLLAFVTAQAPLLKAIARPTAIVSGDCDGIVLTALHSQGCLRDIPGATLTLLPGVGHSPHYAAPDRVVAAIEDVVARAGVDSEIQI